MADTAEASEELAAPIARPASRGLTLREQRATTVKRVLDEFQRSGTLPTTLRELLVDQDHALRWKEGRPMPREAVERHIDEWAADLLSKFDREQEAA